MGVGAGVGYYGAQWNEKLNQNYDRMLAEYHARTGQTYTPRTCDLTDSSCGTWAPDLCVVILT